MSTPHPLHGFFITGTDTEIGKTCVTAGLTRAFDGLGRYVTPIKSLAAGQTKTPEGVWVNEDVAQLHAAQQQGMTMDEVGPLQFREPCAPHIAARLEGRAIERGALLAAIRRSAAKGDLALVEGVGGRRPGDAGGARGRAAPGLHQPRAADGRGRAGAGVTAGRLGRQHRRSPSTACGGQSGRPAPW